MIKKIQKYKFYINFLIFYLKNEFKDLKNNLIIILNDKNMLILFILMLPIVFFVIKIQIFLGILFFFYFFFLFFLHYWILESDYVIDCKEIPLNTKHIYRYSFFNVILFLPKAKAFFIIYNFLNININGNSNKKEKVVLLIMLFIVSFFIKIYILLILGYTYLSIIVTSNLIISYFETISWNYESSTAKNQHIVINCLLDNKDSIGKVDNMKIIIKDSLVIFNSDRFMKYFFGKVVKADKLQKIFSSPKEIISKKFIDGHFSWSVSSSKYKDKNLTKNKTSSKKIKVFKEDNSIDKIDCSDQSNPRFDGQNKPDFLTRTYELNKEKAIIKEIPKDIKIKMQNESKHIYNSIIYDKEQKVLYSENGKFYSKESSPTVKEYTKENSMDMYEKIKDLDDFEKSNEKYLSSDEGKKEYEIFKSLMKGKSFFKDFNDSENNSPYEDFIN